MFGKVRCKACNTKVPRNQTITVNYQTEQGIKQMVLCISCASVLAVEALNENIGVLDQ